MSRAPFEMPPQVTLSERAEIATQRMGAITTELPAVHVSIRNLTIWLVILTVALFGLTAYLAYRENPLHDRSTETAPHKTHR